MSNDPRFCGGARYGPCVMGSYGPETDSVSPARSKRQFDVTALTRSSA